MIEQDGFRAMFSVMAIQQALMWLFSASFLAAAAFNHDPMLPEIYGRAVDYPATAWACWFLIGHSLAGVGLWRGNKFVAMAGLMVVFPAYLFLAVFAQPAAFGSVITLHSFLVGAAGQALIAAVILIFWDRLPDG